MHGKKAVLKKKLVKNLSMLSFTCFTILAGLACPSINLDEMFQWKLAKNLGRPSNMVRGIETSKPYTV